jgi:hypothetical protein
MTGSEHDHGHHQAHAVAVAHAEHRRRVARVLGRQSWTGARRRAVGLVRLRFLRRVLWGLVIFASTATIAVLGLWWRLSSGPIELDLATPWLKAAIEENFGGNHSVAVGGTQLERDEKGRTSLRLRDIIVRDRDGTIVASAPKAEVGISGRRDGYARKVSIWWAPKWPYALRPTAALPYLPARTRDRSPPPHRELDRRA